MSKSALDPKFILRGLQGSVTSVSFGQSIDASPVLLTGFSDGVIKVWDLGLRRPSKTLSCHGGKSILKGTLLNNGKLLSHGRDGKIVLWDAEGDSFAPVLELGTSDLTFCPCAITSRLEAECIIALPSKSSHTSQVDIGMLQKPEEASSLVMSKDQGMVMQMKWCQVAMSMRLLIGDEGGGVTLWDVESKIQLACVKLFDDPVMCMDVDARGKVLAGSATTLLKSFAISCNEEGKVSFSDVTTTDTHQAGYASVCIRDDRRIAAAGGWDGRIRVFGWKKINLLAVLKYHTEAVNCLAFSRDGCLAAGSKDGKVTAWAVYTNDKNA